MRANPRVGALVVAVLVTTLLPVAVNAQPADPPVDEPFTIAAAHSQLCLTTDADIDQPVVQNPCVGGARQLFTTVEFEPGSSAFALRVERGGRCVMPTRTEAGVPQVESAPLTTAPCNPALPDQWWMSTPSTVGGEVLRNVASGLCIDIVAESPDPGAVAAQYQCNGGDNQRLVRVADGPAASGAWGEVFDTGVIAVAMAILPTGKVLLWSSDSPLDASAGSGQTYTALLDPDAEGGPSVTETLVANTDHDMFCPGIAMLPDGRVMINGGGAVGSDSRRATTIYDPFSDEWTGEAAMNRSRWYNSSVVLADGDVVTMGGSGARTTEMGPGDLPERWDETTGWRPLPDADPGLLLDQTPGAQNRSGEHPRMFLREDGQIYVSGPAETMGVLDPKGLGRIEQTDRRVDDGLSQTDSQVMFAPGLVLAAGGSASYDYGDDPGTKAAQIIDVNTGEVARTEPMAFARTNANGVALPTGEVLVIGGMPTPEIYSDDGAVMHPEIWNPGTGRWTTLAPMDVPRTYHSSAVLLPDGRVLAAGGGLCGPACDVNHADGQIFSPPYLFAGARPTITIADRVSYGSVADAVVTGDVERFSMVRMGGATHATNTDQRVIPLAAVETAAGQWELDVPDNGNLAPPGYYMVFAISPDGVPSEAGIVRLLGNDSDVLPSDSPAPYSPTAGSDVVGLPFNDFIRPGQEWESLEVGVDGDDITSVRILTDVEGYDRRGSVGENRTVVPLSDDPLVGLAGTTLGGRITSLTVLRQSGSDIGPIGVRTGTPFALRVPDGQVAQGLQGRSADVLHAVGLLTDADAAGEPNDTVVEPDLEPRPDPGAPAPSPSPTPAPSPPAPSPPPDDIIDPGPAPQPDQAVGPPGIDIGPATSRISAISHAVAISEARFGAAGEPGAEPEAQLAAHGVIARSDVFADALTGTVLTGDGPMLLSNGTTIAEDVEEELRRTLGTSGTVYLLGGETALAPTVETELVAMGYATVRLMGPTRIETAIAVADEAERIYGPRDVVAIARADGPIANGSAWADSVTSGVWSAREGAPILLTPTESLHPSVSAWLGGHRNTQRIAVGGTAAVSAEAAVAAGVDRRVAGPNRFSTAVAIGDELLDDDPGGFVIANGSNPDAWAFALPAAGYAADISWPMLLVSPGIIPAETGEATCRKGERTDALFLGDYSLVSAVQRDFLASPCG